MVRRISAPGASVGFVGFVGFVGLVELVGLVGLDTAGAEKEGKILMPKPRIILIVEPVRSARINCAG